MPSPVSLWQHGPRGLLPGLKCESVKAPRTAPAAGHTINKCQPAGHCYWGYSGQHAPLLFILLVCYQLHLSKHCWRARISTQKEEQVTCQRPFSSPTCGALPRHTGGDETLLWPHPANTSRGWLLLRWPLGSVEDAGRQSYSLCPIGQTFLWIFFFPIVSAKGCSGRGPYFYISSTFSDALFFRTPHTQNGPMQGLDWRCMKEMTP